MTFIWIPGHIGLPLHDKIDQAAKKSTRLPKITDPSPLPSYDLKNAHRTSILATWHKQWEELSNTSQNKLRSIKDKPTHWSSSSRASRQEEVILARLRIGHTRLTHTYLFQHLHAPPSCNYCHAENLTVEHLFLCPFLRYQRSIHNVPHSISSALRNNSSAVSDSLNYLRSTYFFPFCKPFLFFSFFILLMYVTKFNIVRIPFELITYM